MLIKRGTRHQLYINIIRPLNFDHLKAIRFWLNDLPLFVGFIEPNSVPSMKTGRGNISKRT